MSVLREYVKIKYMGDCKCGRCHLVPVKVLHEQNLYIDRLRDLVEIILQNDPSETIADNGMTVLDNWRYRAKQALVPPAVSRADRGVGS